MKSFSIILTIFLTICFAKSIFAQCENENCGLVVRGKITNLEIEKQKSEILFYVNLDVEFINNGSQPIILFVNEFADGYWLGGWSLYENTKAIFSDGYWQSIIGSDSYRKMADKLNVKTPPDESTKILQPKESWKFTGDFRIYFEAEKHTRFPEHKTWKEMQGFPSKLWLTISYELSP